MKPIEVITPLRNDLAERECFIAEGRLAVEALLDSGSFELANVQIEEGRHGGLLERLEAEGVPFQLRSRRELQVEAGYDFHRGVFARVNRPCSAEPSSDDLQRTARLVFPVGLADPGNLGTVVRNGVAFGADGIVLERDRGADIWSRKSIRASATGVFRIPIYRPRGIEDFLIRARDSGFVVFGTSLSKGAKALRKVERARKSLILLGAERDGLSRELEALCDELVHIPMQHGMDSLNVGSTSAIVFHELFSREN